MTQPCPVCFSAPAEAAVIAVCRSCGLGSTIQITSNAEVQDYTGEEIAAGRLGYFDRLYRTYFANLKPGRSLDVGCGGGLLLRRMELGGWTAVGLDSFANDRPPAGVMRATLSEFESEIGFDLITLVHAFEHLPEPREALTKLRSLLAADGRLLIIVPNFGGAWSKVTREEWPWLNTEEHYFHYTISSLQRLLTEQGFRIVSVRTRSREAPPLLAAFVGVLRLYERPIGRNRLIRSIVFHVAKLSGPPVNWLLDKLGMGAEIVIVAA